MKRKPFLFYSLGALSFAAALLLPPRIVLNAMLPSQFMKFETRLIYGLWLTKGALAVDGILIACWPLIRRWLFSSNRIPILKHLTPDQPTQRIEWIAMLFLAGIAFIPRVHDLSSGFAFDEITMSESGAERSLPHLLVRSEPHRVVNAFLAFCDYRLFGISEEGGRIPSLLAGIASVPLLYLLVRNWGSPREAFAAAAVLVLSTFHVWYSQLMTSYALGFMTILLSMLALERIMKTGSDSAWFNWGLSLFLALLVNFQLMMFVQFAMLLRIGVPTAPRLAALRWHEVLKAVFVSIYAGAFAFTLFCPNFFLWAGMIRGLAGSSDAAFVQTEPRGSASDQSILFFEWLTNMFAPRPLQLLLAGIVVLGMVVWSRRRAGVVIYLLLPSLAFWFAFYAELIRRVTPRHSIFSLIPLCIFAGAGLAYLWELPARFRDPIRRIAAATLAIVASIAVVAGGALSLAEYASRERFPMRQTAHFLASQPPGIPVYIGGFGLDGFQYYFPQLKPVGTYDELNQLLKDGNSFYLLYSSNGEVDYLKSLPEDLRQRLLKNGRYVFEHHGRPEHYLDMSDAFVIWFNPTAPNE